MTESDRDGRSTRWDPHRRERRQLIVNAAISAIEEHGPNAVTAQIAERAGVPRTHVYRHFDGKAALDLAVARHLAKSLALSFRPAIATAADGSARDVVRSLIGPFLAWVELNPNLYRFLATRAYTVRDTGGHSDDAKAILGDELTVLVAAYLTALGAPSAPLGRVVAGLVGLVDSSAAWWLDNGDNAREELAAQLTDEALLILVAAAAGVGITLDPDSPLPPLGVEIATPATAED